MTVAVTSCLPLEPALIIKAKEDKTWLTLDEILDCVGQCGRAQAQIVAAASLSFIPMACIMFSMVFTTMDPINSKQWRCVSELDIQCQAVFELEKVGPAFCDLTPVQYSFTHSEYSLVTDFHLYCNNAWKASFLDSFYFVGLAAGGILFGAMSDSYGRRKTLYFCTALTAICTALSTITSNFWWHFVFRSLSSMGVQGMSTAEVILVTEPVGSKYRGRVGVITQQFFIAGEALLALLAFLVPSWRALNQLCAVLCGAFLLTWFLVPESPRWLASKGHNREALEILQGFAEKNRRSIPDGTMLLSDNSNAMTSAEVQPAIKASFKASPITVGASVASKSGGQDQDLESEQPSGSLLEQQVSLLSHRERVDNACDISIMQALRQPELRSCFFALSFTLLAMEMAYYGVSFGLDGFSGNPYLNFFYLALAEVPASISITLLIDRIGRLPIILSGMITSGVSCMLCGGVTGTARIVFAMLGKFGSSAAWSTLVVYSSEVFPTSVRSILPGSMEIMGAMGGVTAPFLFLWAHSIAGLEQLPFFTIGAITIVALLMCMWLPETCGHSQPDTLKDFQRLTGAGNSLINRLRKWMAGKLVQLKSINV